jgi:hypothetical protein
VWQQASQRENPEFAVRENLCRAFSFGRTAKGIFAVRLLHSAREKTFGKKSLPCVFLLAHGKHFSPTGRYPR